MDTEDRFEGLGEILHQMKAIGHLHRLRRPLANARFIRSRTVTGDHAHLGMDLKPGCHGVRQAILEHVDRTATFQIDHDRAVAVALAPGPIIDADHLRRRIRGRGKTSYPSEDGVATARHALTGQLPGTGGTPRASPVKAWLWLNRVVVRAYSGATPGRRSVKVWRSQVGVGQKKRRTDNRSRIVMVAQGKSASVRW